MVTTFLERNGFENKGGASHDKFKHPDGRQTVVPRHSEISEITFREIKKQAGLK
ncbi:MAG: type II toxin-antitoxin system HicA family toxin [Coriobacteriia bacterium]|nr:type II toxin-antitoxin system HicA family toxin [Coriobacteriia bacterium]